MLYPDFNDLLSYQQHRRDRAGQTRRKMATSSPGNHTSAVRGRGLDFDAVREYVLGDDIRNIDWRVTARTGSPHLKLFKEEKERHTIICVDMNADMRFGTKNTFKSVQAARCASLLAWRALAQRERMSACLFGDIPGGLHYFASSRTRQALCRLLKLLTEPPTEQEHVPLSAALKQIERAAPTGSIIYLISDFVTLTPDVLHEPTLIRLNKRCDLIMISVNDALDQALVPTGTLGFRGANAANVFLNTDHGKGREAYAAQWAANRTIVNRLTERFQIPMISLSTESDISRDLPIGLKQTTRRTLCRR